MVESCRLAIFFIIVLIVAITEYLQWNQTNGVFDNELDIWTGHYCGMVGQTNPHHRLLLLD